MSGGGGTLKNHFFQRRENDCYFAFYVLSDRLTRADAKKIQISRKMGRAFGLKKEINKTR